MYLHVHTASKGPKHTFTWGTCQRRRRYYRSSQADHHSYPHCQSAVVIVTPLPPFQNMEAAAGAGGLCSSVQGLVVVHGRCESMHGACRGHN